MLEALQAGGLHLPADASNCPLLLFAEVKTVQRTGWLWCAAAVCELSQLLKPWCEDSGGDVLNCWEDRTGNEKSLTW